MESRAHAQDCQKEIDPADHRAGVHVPTFFWKRAGKSNNLDAMSASDRLPNILFLMTDQQRFDAVGYANPNVITPNLDRLAAESVVFTRAYVTSPSCIPSRASIYTGKYPSQNGCPTFASRLPETETTFMALLQDAGYHTAIIGKQHFHGSTIRRGYDEEDIVDVHGLMDLSRKLSDARDGKPQAGRPEDPDDVLNSYEHFCAQHGITSEADVFERRERMSGAWTGDIQFHVDHYIGERGRDWLLHRRPHDKPWYLCVSFPGPHNPYDCQETAYAESYRETELESPATTAGDLDGKPPHYRLTKANQRPVDRQEMDRIRLGYRANVTLIDEKIGNILEALRQSGGYENTLVIFSTDHGDFMGDFDRIAKGQYLAEALMHVPLLVKPPLGGFPGRSVDSLVSLVDLGATCLRAAGIEPAAGMSSSDWTPCWRTGAAPVQRGHVFMEGAGLKAVRTEDWKLVCYLDRPYGELYNLKEDPWEKANLWDAPKHLETKDRLKSLLIDQLIKMNPGWDTPWSDTAPPPI